MVWVKFIWNTGEVESTGPYDAQNIRFQGVIRKQQGDMPPGSVPINQIKYCVDTLLKFDDTFCLWTHTSAAMMISRRP
eukprot:6448080-Amphidinium_carterae.3